jgi:hypothetical protein
VFSDKHPTTRAILFLLGLAEVVQEAARSPGARLASLDLERRLHEILEACRLAWPGVPRPQVLRAATADAWRYLGQPHEAAVIEPGARADRLVVASDPLRAGNYLRS